MIQFHLGGIKYWCKYDKERMAKMFKADSYDERLQLAWDISEQYFRKKNERNWLAGLLVAFSYEKKRQRSLRGFQKFCFDVWKNRSIDNLVALQDRRDVKSLRPHYQSIIDTCFSDYLKIDGGKRLKRFSDFLGKVLEISNWSFD